MIYAWEQGYDNIHIRTPPCVGLYNVLHFELRVGCAAVDIAVSHMHTRYTSGYGVSIPKGTVEN